MMVNVCTKFHENIINGIRVMERTPKVYGRTSGHTNSGLSGFCPSELGGLSHMVLYSVRKNSLRHHVSLKKGGLQ